MQPTNTKRYLPTSVFLLIFLYTTTLGKIIYVDANAPGTNDGSSWVHAYNYLQDALADAASAEKPVEIRVAQGVYKPDKGANQTPGDKKAVFQLINGLTLKGGYAGLGEPDPNTKDLDVYETILSGDLAGDDVTVDDPCDLPKAVKGYNSYTVVTGSGTDSTAVIDGFIISGSPQYPIADRAGPNAPPDSHGGMFNLAGNPTVINCMFTSNMSAGMRNVNDSRPTLVNCTFEKNYGSGMENTNSNPKLTDCEFSNNFGLYGGGAMYNWSSSPTLVECIFSDNRAVIYGSKGGGAIYNQDSSPTLMRCTFQCNSAYQGGAIFNRESACIFAECVFRENSAVLGGAICDIDSDSRTVFTNCTFVRNTATTGGALTIGSSIITRCIFIENTANFQAGAMETYGPTLANFCIFVGNRVLGHRSNGVRDIGRGGVAYAFDAAVFTNCTFSDNWADHGNAIFRATYRLLEVHNCILWGSKNQIYSQEGWPDPHVYFSTIKDSWLTNDGNIDVNPCFIDPGRWVTSNDQNQAAEPNDPNAIWIDGDYHLKSQAGRWDPNAQSWVKDNVTSPCIDAGDPASPIGNEPFPNGGRINMGAYGGTDEASKSYFGEPICETIVAGDINGDCKVDFTDFFLLSNHWLIDNSQ